MGKSKDTRRLQANQAQAVCNALRTSPASLTWLPNRSADWLLRRLLPNSLSKKRIAKSVLKVLQSAIANAENNHQLNIDKLFVSEAYCGKGLVMKRMHARGRGRGARVLKPFSNITIVVTERQE